MLLNVTKTHLETDKHTSLFKNHNNLFDIASKRKVISLNIRYETFDMVS